MSGFLAGLGAAGLVSTVLGLFGSKPNPINQENIQKIKKLEQELETKNQQIQKAFEEAKKMGDPEHFAKKKK